MEISFCEYANGEYDAEYDQYLDFLGMWGWEVNMESVEAFLFHIGHDISADARIAIVEYVKAKQEGELWPA